MSQSKPFSSAWFISVVIQLLISISTLSAHKRKALTQMELMMRYGQGKSSILYLENCSVTESNSLQMVQFTTRATAAIVCVMVLS